MTLAEPSLRQKVVEGGTFLVMRRGVGICVSLIGMLLLTRLIGPGPYGLYATIAVITAYVIDVCAVGIRDFLVRKEEEVESKYFHSAFTFILLTTTVAFLLGSAIAYPLSRWLNSPSLVLPLIVSLAAVPFNALMIPSMAKMERELNFRFIAWMEFHMQTIYYLLALTLAFFHAGVWAPVLANLLKVFIASFICWKIAKYRPRILWQPKTLGEMLRYGVGNVSARMVWYLRSLVNPLIVGRIAGPEAVACVSLAFRLIDALSFVNNAILHVSFSVISKIRRESRTLEKALDEAMFIQLIALAPFLIGFALFSQWVFPMFFRDSWFPVLELFPYLALAAIVNAIFSLHAVVLFVEGSNRIMFRFGLTHTMLLGISSWFLVHWLGVQGYAWSEILTIASFGIIHYGVKRICRVDYKTTAIAFAACIPSFFLTSAPFPWAVLLMAPLPLALALPIVRRRIMSNVHQVIRHKGVMT